MPSLICLCFAQTVYGFGVGWGLSSRDREEQSSPLSDSWQSLNFAFAFSIPLVFFEER